MGRDVMESYVYRNGGFYGMQMLLPFLFIFIVVPLILSGILKWLWNMTMPQIFKLPEITYWEAFRLILITAILFSGGLGLRMG